MTYTTTFDTASIPITYNVDEPTSWKGYSLDNAANITLTGDTTLSGLSLGSHSLTIYATDMSGNTGFDMVSFKIEKEGEPKPPMNEPPEAVTLYEPTEITQNSMMLAWTQNEDFDFKAYILYYSTSVDSIGQKVIEITSRSDISYGITGLEEDTRYYFVVRVTDTVFLYNDSNQVSAETIKTIIIEDEPPKLTILSPTNTTYDQPSVELTWLSDEPLKWAGFNLNGGVNTTINGNITIVDLEDGPYELTLYGTDLHGNNGSDSVSFTISTIAPDTKPPDIIHTPVTDGIEGNPIIISAIITDESGVEEAAVYYRKGGDTDYIRLEMNTVDLNTYAAEIPASFVETETIEYYIFASDNVNQATQPPAAPTSSPYIIQINLYPNPVTLYEPLGEAISTTTIALTWSESDVADFDNYTLYKSGSQGVLGDAVKTLTQRSETSHTVESLSPDTTYYFTVRVSDVGGLHADSNQMGVHTEVIRVPWTTYIFGLSGVISLGALGGFYAIRKRRK